MDYFPKLLKIANENGFKLTKNAERIAFYRSKVDLPLWVCPCHARKKEYGCQLKNGKGMKKRCKEDILKNGQCSCSVFCKM